MEELKKWYIVAIMGALAVGCLGLGCSSKELSRGKAAEMIKARLEARKITKEITIAESHERGILYLQYYENKYDNAHQVNELGDTFANAEERWLALEKKGFLKFKMISKRVPNNGGQPTYFLGRTLRGEPNQFPGQLKCPHTFNCMYYDAFSLEFTPAAKPYVQLKETTQRAALREFVDIITIVAVITTATLDEVGVTGMTVPAEREGKKFIEAKYFLKYKPTPIGEVYISNQNSQELQPGTAFFVLYDDGWRLEEL